MNSICRAYLLETSPLDAYAHMALDEAVLDSSEAGAAFLRLYRWSGGSPRAVTFGYAQRYEAVESAVRERCGGLAFPVVRRCTGGGIVYHDTDITFSFVFPWPRLLAPSLIYKNIHLGIHLGLKSRGAASRLWSPGVSIPAARAECFSGPEPADLVTEDGAKLLGGALRRRKGRGLYQGSMRAERLRLGTEGLRDALAEGFGLQYSLLFRPAEPTPRTAAQAERLGSEKYRRDTWNKKR